MLTLNRFTCSVLDKQLFAGDAFSLTPGRVTVILGASGSGKTRFLKGLCGITTDLQGQLSWRGEPLTAPHYAVIRVGVLFQNSALLDGLTVLENLQLAAAGNHDDFDPALHRLDLADSGGFYPDQMSEGMKRRVALLRAGQGDPELVLLDEPLAGLDAASRRRVLEVVSQWLADGRGVLFSTHLLTGLEQLDADYYAIADGELRGAYGSLAEVKQLFPELLQDNHEI